MTSWFGGVDIFVLVSMRGWSATTCGCEEDWLGMGGHLAAAGGLSVMYAKDKISYFKNVLEGWAKSGHTLPTPTSIVDVTMVLVSLVDFFNGFEFPDDGQLFTSGYYAFDSVHSTLVSATPDSRDWSGPAAKIYTQENAELASIVEQMQNLDSAMQEKMASQAAVIQQAHSTVGLGVAGLIAAHAIALAIYLNPAYGPVAAFWWQLAAAAGICSAVLAFEAKAAEHAQTIADEVQSIGREYDDLAARALDVAASAGVGADPISAPDSVIGGPALPAAPSVAAMVELSAGSAWVDERAGLSLAANAEEPTRRSGPVLSSLSVIPLTSVAAAPAQSRSASRRMNFVDQKLSQQPRDDDSAAALEVTEFAAEGAAGPVPVVRAMVSAEFQQKSRQLEPIG